MSYAIPITLEVPVAGSEDGLPTRLVVSAGGDVLVRCYNQCGHDLTELDLRSLLDHLKAHWPQLLLAALGPAWPGTVAVLKRADTLDGTDGIPEVAWRVPDPVGPPPEWVTENGRYGIVNGRLWDYAAGDTPYMEVPAGSWVVTHGVCRHWMSDERFREMYEIASDPAAAVWGK